MEVVSQYLFQYTGVGKVFRAYKLVKESSLKAHKADIIKLALSICVEQNLPGYYDLIMIEQKVQVESQHVAWYQPLKQKIDQFASKKNQEITTFKQQKNTVSARFSMLELAKFHLDQGNVFESARNYDKANTYRQQGDSVLEFIDDYSTALLFNEDYEKLAVLQPELQGYKPNQIEMKEKVSIAHTCQLLRSLIQQEYNDFFDICKNRLIPDDLPDSITNITSVKDLGNYVVLCGFFHNRKLKDKKEFTHFHVLYNNENISPLMVGSPLALQAADTYTQMYFGKSLAFINQMIQEDLKFDTLFPNKFNSQRVIQKNFLIEYLKPYNMITFEKVAQEFQFDQKSLVNQIESLLKDQSKSQEETQLNFLIDPIEGKLIQKVTEQSKKVRTYNKAVKEIQKYMTEKQRNLLHYKLNTVIREGKEFIDIDAMRGDDMIAQAMQGFR